MSILRDRCVAFGLQHKRVLGKIPVVNSLSRRLYRLLKPPVEAPVAMDGTRSDSRKAENVDYSSLSVSEIRERMNERFAGQRAYPMTVLWDEARAEELNQGVLEMMGAVDDKQILEIGCGVGGSAACIPKCRSFTGTDLSEVAIRQASQAFSQKSHVRFLAMDAMALGFRNERFDVVVAKEAIEHLPDPKKAVREAYRVLKPNGLFVITSPNRDSLHLRMNRKLGYKDFKCSFDHIHEFAFDEAVCLLEGAGFVVRDTGGVFLQPYWGIPGVDGPVRHLTDNDPEVVEILRDLGRRVGARYAFCYVIACLKPSGAGTRGSVEAAVHAAERGAQPRGGDLLERSASKGGR